MSWVESAPFTGGPSLSTYAIVHDIIYSITSFCWAVIEPGAFSDIRPSVHGAPYIRFSAAIAALVRSAIRRRRDALARARGDLEWLMVTGRSGIG